MPWKCPNSGTENADDKAVCIACGFVRASKVTLVSQASGKTMALAVDTAIGKAALGPLGDADYVYASEPQFHIVRNKATGDWTIISDSLAKNPTFLNSRLLTESTSLQNGAIISIGPSRLKLTVGIQFI